MEPSLWYLIKNLVCVATFSIPENSAAVPCFDPVAQFKYTQTWQVGYFRASGIS